MFSDDRHVLDESLLRQRREEESDSQSHQNLLLECSNATNTTRPAAAAQDNRRGAILDCGWGLFGNRAAKTVRKVDGAAD